MTYDNDDIRKFGSQDIYTKYLRFHENIIVDLNPKLRWCSKPGCLSYVEKAKKKNQPSVCQCGYEMCFKCGQAWHPDRPCKKYDDYEAEFYNYAANNDNFTKCPKCKARAEREEGKCNHITCTRCNY